jgi:hypothetical protein
VKKKNDNSSKKYLYINDFKIDNKGNWSKVANTLLIDTKGGEISFERAKNIYVGITDNPNDIDYITRLLSHNTKHNVILKLYNYNTKYINQNIKVYSDLTKEIQHIKSIRELIAFEDEFNECFDKNISKIINNNNLEIISIQTEKVNQDYSLIFNSILKKLTKNSYLKLLILEGNISSDYQNDEYISEIRSKCKKLKIENYIQLTYEPDSDDEFIRELEESVEVTLGQRDITLNQPIIFEELNKTTTIDYNDNMEF